MKNVNKLSKLVEENLPTEIEVLRASTALDDSCIIFKVEFEMETYYIKIDTIL